MKILITYELFQQLRTSYFEEVVETFTFEKFRKWLELTFNCKCNGYYPTLYFNSTEDYVEFMLRYLE